MLSSKIFSRVSGGFFLLLLVIFLAACSGSSTPPRSQAARTPTAAPTITGPTNPGVKTCQPGSPIDNSAVGPEAQGTGVNAELWALLMSTSGVPPVVNTEVKIVWRMTGSGDFTIVAISPLGTHVSPTQGPEEHMGSNWNRPGDEWGTVFNFPVVGCWDLHATRDNAFGDVWLQVVD